MNIEHRESFFRHVEQHCHGHGDMLKFTTAEILQTFIQRLGVSQVEFVDEALEMPRTLARVGYDYDCRDIPCGGSRPASSNADVDRATSDDPTRAVRLGFPFKKSAMYGLADLFQKKLEASHRHTLGRARNWMSPLIETAGVEITMAIVSMAPLKSQVSL
jgi:hypothetical protein